MYKRQAYYDGTDLMDIRVVSTLGLTDEDIEALRDVPGVSGVEAAYSADVLATLNDEQYVMRDVYKRQHHGRPLGVLDLRLDARGLWRLPDEGALGERGRRRVPYRRRAHLRGVVRRELR